MILTLFILLLVSLTVDRIFIHYAGNKDNSNNSPKTYFINGSDLISPWNISKSAVYAECKSFSQTARLLGPLHRNLDNGVLHFANAKDSLEDVVLLIRYAPRSEEHGLFLQIATSYLLSANLKNLNENQRHKTKAFIFLSEKFSKELTKQFENWLAHIFKPYVEELRVISTIHGNQASWEFMINYTTHEPSIQLNTLLFLLEDDYIYETHMLSDTIKFFASHNPCFVHPTDYPDRYSMSINNDDGFITMVAGETCVWRSITSTTVTYACRLKTLIAFRDILMNPNNDWGLSNEIRRRAGNAVFFSAIPSHGAHTETLQIKNTKSAKFQIRTAAYYKDWWKMGRQVLLEAQRKPFFPFKKIDETYLT